jgi:hypothetical protein
MHKARPSSVCSSQHPLEHDHLPVAQVVCLIGIKWPFAQDHLFPILFRTTKEFDLFVRSNSGAECTES